MINCSEFFPLYRLCCWILYLGIFLIHELGVGKLEGEDEFWNLKREGGIVMTLGLPLLGMSPPFLIILVLLLGKNLERWQ